MAIDFYYFVASAPCRAVLLAAKAVGVELNLIETNLREGEHLRPQFIKMNPQHTIPTINDNGFCLWESRAILGYLVDQYGKDDKLYPKNPKQRALVDQRLYFDATTLNDRFGNYYYPMFLAGQKSDEEKLKRLKEAFGILNTFLEDKTWVAGENMTIADLSLVTTVSTADAVDFPVSDYPNVVKWYARVKKEAPGYSVNAEGAKMFAEFFKNRPGQ